MNINKMKRSEFEALPHRKWNQEVVCNSLIILPLRRMHDSGYRCMDFVAIVGENPVCLLSGCSDVIHLDGVGGYGYKWMEKYNAVPNSILPSGWSVDCLAKSGLFRIWPSSGKILCASSLSSFEIYALDKDDPHQLFDPSNLEI
jgi:hypothetical protein